MNFWKQHAFIAKKPINSAGVKFVSAFLKPESNFIALDFIDN